MVIVNGIGCIGYMKGGGKVLWKDENIVDLIIIYVINFICEYKDELFFMYFVMNDVYVLCFLYECFCGKNLMGLCGDVIV